MILIRRRRISRTSLLPFAGAALAVLFLAALFYGESRTREEWRFTKVRIGDAYVLEGSIPVRRVRSTFPKVASAHLDTREGLVLRGHRAGVTEVSYERADGRRMRYLVAVRANAAIPVRLDDFRRRVVARPKARPRDSAMAAVRPRKKPPDERKVKAPLREVKPEGQVVQVDPPEKSERPDHARFLSEYDSKVARETRARATALKRGAPGPNRPGSPGAMTAPPPQPLPPSTRKRAPTDRAIASQQTTPPNRAPSRSPPAQPRSETARVLDAPKGPNGVLPSAREAALQRPANDANRRATPPGDESRPAATEPPASGPALEGAAGQRLELMPSADVLHRVLRGEGGGQGGGQAFPDHLKGVAVGDRTFLNTKEWKGASFFNRVKAAVAAKWNPAEVYARRDPTGNIYGVKDRHTLLHVTLNTDGSLRHLKVLGASGVDFLDEEAMGAFEAAQPFPNPPDEVKDKDGLIRFKFAFYFVVSDEPLFRITR
jgi:TonB family protein